MPKITDEELEALQIRLFKTDLDYLRALYRGHFGVNKAVRQIVRAYIIQAKAHAASAIDEIESTTLSHTELRAEDLI
jgi:hypothetical protein